MEQHKMQPRDDADIEYSTGSSSNELPDVVSLSQNLPNPFGAGTAIAYALPKDGHVLLEIYSVAGRLVRTLVDGERPAGRWSVLWDGLNDDGRPAANGVYFYRFTAGGRSIEKRMVLVN
jgi:hypothetical protein